jgi:hypothetical protein
MLGTPGLIQSGSSPLRAGSFIGPDDGHEVIQDVSKRLLQLYRTSPL